MALGGAPQPAVGAAAEASNRRREIAVFLITTLVVIPGAAVGVVGAFGLIVWLSQLIFGPPGPPT